MRTPAKKQHGVKEARRSRDENSEHETRTTKNGLPWGKREQENQKEIANNEEES